MTSNIPILDNLWTLSLLVVVLKIFTKLCLAVFVLSYCFNLFFSSFLLLIIGGCMEVVYILCWKFSKSCSLCLSCGALELKRLLNVDNPAPSPPKQKNPTMLNGFPGYGFGFAWMECIFSRMYTRWELYQQIVSCGNWCCT